MRRIPALDTVTEVPALRHTVRAELAGRRFEQFPVDVAIGEHSVSEVEWLPGPNLLAFAGIQAPDVPLIALDRHVAEKLHAYTRVYGPGGRESTRVKDLIDIVLIGDLTQLDAGRVRRALEDTFTRRAMQTLPEAVPAPPRSWARPYAEIARQVGAAPSLDEGHAMVAAMLDPILSLTTTSGTWDPDTKCWRTPIADG